MAKYIYSEQDKEIITQYFFGLKMNSKKNYLNWCETIKNLPVYMDSGSSKDFIFNDSQNNNLVTFILSSSKLKTSLNPFSKINNTKPDWNHQNIDGEHSLFLIMRKGYINDSYCKKVIDKLNVDTEIKNNKNQYFTHLIFEKEMWNNLFDIRMDFEDPNIDYKKIKPFKVTDSFHIFTKMFTVLEKVKNVLTEYEHHFNIPSEQIKEYKKNWDAISKFLINVGAENIDPRQGNFFPHVKEEIYEINKILLRYNLETNLEDKSSTVKKMKI